ncbi:MAG: sortase [Holophagales bacterium]|nr:sortase [Holophagales bacterium]
MREGDDDATLSVAVGRVPGTARPGERGNMALAGHRDSFFRGLRHIRVDDVIRFRTPDTNTRTAWTRRRSSNRRS